MENDKVDCKKIRVDSPAFAPPPSLDELVQWEKREMPDEGFSFWHPADWSIKDTLHQYSDFGYCTGTSKFDFDFGKNYTPNSMSFSLYVTEMLRKQHFFSDFTDYTFQYWYDPLSDAFYKDTSNLGYKGPSVLRLSKVCVTPDGHTMGGKKVGPLPIYQHDWGGDMGCETESYTILARAGYYPVTITANLSYCGPFSEGDEGVDINNERLKVLIQKMLQTVDVSDYVNYVEPLY